MNVLRVLDLTDFSFGLGPMAFRDRSGRLERSSKGAVREHPCTYDSGIILHSQIYEADTNEL